MIKGRNIIQLSPDPSEKSMIQIDSDSDADLSNLNLQNQNIYDPEKVDFLEQNENIIDLEENQLQDILKQVQGKYFPSNQQDADERSIEGFDQNDQEQSFISERTEIQSIQYEQEINQQQYYSKQIIKNNYDGLINKKINVVNKNGINRKSSLEVRTKIEQILNISSDSSLNNPDENNQFFDNFDDEFVIKKQQYKFSNMQNQLDQEEDCVVEIMTVINDVQINSNSQDKLLSNKQVKKNIKFIEKSDKNIEYKVKKQKLKAIQKQAQSMQDKEIQIIVDKYDEDQSNTQQIVQSTELIVQINESQNINTNQLQEDIVQKDSKKIKKVKRKKDLKEKSPKKKKTKIQQEINTTTVCKVCQKLFENKDTTNEEYCSINCKEIQNNQQNDQELENSIEKQKSNGQQPFKKKVEYLKKSKQNRKLNYKKQAAQIPSLQQNNDNQSYSIYQIWQGIIHNDDFDLKIEQISEKIKQKFGSEYSYPKLLFLVHHYKRDFVQIDKDIYQFPLIIQTILNQNI